MSSASMLQQAAIEAQAALASLNDLLVSNSNPFHQPPSAPVPPPTNRKRTLAPVAPVARKRGRPNYRRRATTASNWLIRRPTIRNRIKNTVTSEIVQTKRTGYTPRISAALLRSQYLSVRASHPTMASSNTTSTTSTTSTTTAYADPDADLNVDEFKFPMPDQEINSFIDSELRRFFDEKSKRDATEVIPDVSQRKFISQVQRNQRRIQQMHAIARDIQLGVGGPKLADLQAPFVALRQQRAFNMAHMSKLRRFRTNKLSTEMIAAKVADMSTSIQHLRLNETILRVVLFHPHTHLRYQEWLLLGSQTLANLRDIITCSLEQHVPRADCPSSMFLIEDGLYDDTRIPWQRYSSKFVEWSKRERNATQYSVHDMQHTKMESLSVRLGSHYAFIHHGDCRHTFVISEIRMANAGDVQNARVFPLCVFQARHAAPRCIACELQVPTKVVYEDPLASQSPAFYCDRCFDLLHKRADGSKIVPDLVEFPYFKS